MSVVIVYTDGGCAPNPGAGGWAALLSYGEHEKMLVGSYAHTTNSRMEIMAVIEAFKSLKRPGLDVEVYTDSNYVCESITLGWLEGWKRKGWKKKANKEIKNRDLWQELDGYLGKHNAKFFHVKAHSGVERNERVDEALRVARNRRTNYRRDEFYEQLCAAGKN